MSDMQRAGTLYTHHAWAMACSFSHPVSHLDDTAVLINSGSGEVESITSIGPGGSLCSQFVVHAKIPFSPWETLSSSMNVTIQGGSVMDVFGLTFPNASNTTTIDHRYASKPASAFRLMW